MKLRIKIFALLISFVVVIPGFANINAANGLYIGGAFGYCHNALPEGAPLIDSFIEIAFNGFARLFGGYRFSDYLAIEGGYVFLRDNNNPAPGTIGVALGPDHAKQSAIDLAAKWIYPFASGFSVYAKAGGAYVHQDVYNKIFASDSQPLLDSNVNKLLPLLGIGVSYNFNKNIALSLDYSHIQGSGMINNIDMLGASLTFTIA